MIFTPLSVYLFDIYNKSPQENNTCVFKMSLKYKYDFNVTNRQNIPKYFFSNKVV